MKLGVGSEVFEGKAPVRGEVTPLLGRLQSVFARSVDC